MLKAFWRTGVCPSSAGRISCLSRTRLFSSKVGDATFPSRDTPLIQSRCTRCKQWPSHSHCLSQPQTRTYTLFSKFRDNFNEAKKGIWRRRPVQMSLYTCFAVGMTATLLYVVYDHITRVEPQFARFPKPVSDRLRKAIYYTDIELNPVRALHFYKQALLAAEQVGLHPFSEEVLGIRLQIPHMLEKAGMMKPAIEILEKTQQDCLEWVQNGRRKQLLRERERAVNARERTDGPTAVEEERAQLEKEAAEERQRGFVMKRVAGVGVKIAALYSSDHMRDPKNAEKALLKAVDLSRSELEYRRQHNLPVSQSQDQNKGNDNENAYYLNLTEVASAFNEVADFYSQQGRNDIATALYMQSLALIKEDEQDRLSTCAQVVLLNNISSQMAEQAQHPASAKMAAEQASGTHLPPVSRDQLLNAASEWAKKALDVASKIEPPVRNEDCDQACMTATYNLGEIAEMQGFFTEAKKYYTEAKEIAKKLQFLEGVERADEGLARVQKQV